jgi:hypothetical protein
VLAYRGRRLALTSIPIAKLIDREREADVVEVKTSGRMPSNQSAGPTPSLDA